MVKILFDHNADVNFSNNRKESALHVAAYYGHAKICRFLIANGANVSAEDYEKDTPLHLAAQLGIHHFLYNIIFYMKMNVNHQFHCNFFKVIWICAKL